MKNSGSGTSIALTFRPFAKVCVIHNAHDISVPHTSRRIRTAHTCSRLAIESLLSDEMSAGTCAPNPSDLVPRLSSRHGVDKGSNGGCSFRLGLRIWLWFSLGIRLCDGKVTLQEGLYTSWNHHEATRSWRPSKNQKSKSIEHTWRSRLLLFRHLAGTLCLL